MRKKQRGVSLMGLMVGAVILIFAALLGFKLLPSYIEFFAIKKAVVGIAQDRSGATVAEIRKAFDARAAIDDFNAVKAADIEITKEGGQVIISAAWRKEMPLFANLGVYIDFVASSKD